MGERSGPRIDKKRDVKPRVHAELKDMIYRLASITDVSVIELSERLIRYAGNDKRILSDLSSYFVRSININNVLYVGHLKAPRIGKSPTGINYVQIKTRLNENIYFRTAEIALALDVTTTRCAAILINEAFHNEIFMDSYVKEFLSGHITDHQLRQLRLIIDYVNRDENYNVSWATLLSYIMNEVKEPIVEVKEKVNNFIVNHWRDK